MIHLIKIFGTIDATESEVNFAKECLHILSQKDGLGKNEVLPNYKLDMQEFTCGTSCCLAGAHKIYYKRHLDVDCFEAYLNLHKISSDMAAMCFSTYWSDNKSEAKKRLELVAKYRKIILLEFVYPRSSYLNANGLYFTEKDFYSQLKLLKKTFKDGI